MPPLWPPASHHLHSSCPHRLPRPLRLHVHEPVGSPVHGEAYGQPPGLHGQPSERPADSECIGDAPQCPGLHVPSHHSCCGPALRNAGGPHRNQLGRPAQLSGGCPVLSQDSPAVGTFSQAAPGAEPAHSRCLLGACCRVWAVSAVFPPTEPSCRVSSGRDALGKGRHLVVQETVAKKEPPLWLQGSALAGISCLRAGFRPWGTHPLSSSP